MSYILEALKKAQAERQLGSAPTLNAQPIQAAPDGDAGQRRIVVWAALAVLGLGAAAFAGYQWRSERPAPAPGAAPVATAPAPAVPAPSAEAPVFAAAPAPARVPAPAVAAAPAPHPTPAPKPEPAPAPVAPVAAVPSAPSAPSAPPVEENLPSVRDLPEALARELPKVTFGGYMYSANPADRLLLVDKVLRHEGEEVAPGLVLEKLQPKSAVMNYRGFRYRAPY
ncbi:MAG: general secretion pathway protein GspB [Gammaproteobacteria bacterium]